MFRSCCWFGFFFFNSPLRLQERFDTVIPDHSFWFSSTLARSPVCSVKIIYEVLKETKFLSVKLIFWLSFFMTLLKWVRAWHCRWKSLLPVTSTHLALGSGLNYTSCCELCCCELFYLIEVNSKGFSLFYFVFSFSFFLQQIQFHSELNNSSGKILFVWLTHKSTQYMLGDHWKSYISINFNK